MIGGLPPATAFYIEGPPHDPTIARPENLLRLWSLHPKYLDRRGLVALWREGLLAQAVLRGKTRGYTHHPQLARFRDAGAPVGSLANYLREVHREATRRGYAFDRTKLARSTSHVPMSVTRGQLEFEWAHLMRKLRQRDPAWIRGLPRHSRVLEHPSFRVVDGGVEAWERGVV